MNQSTLTVPCPDWTDAYAVHQAVWECLRGEVGNDGHGRLQYLSLPGGKVMVRSEVLPGVPVVSPDAGKQCLFYTEANPVQRYRTGARETFHPIREPAALSDWLEQKAAGRGFELLRLVEPIILPPKRANKGGASWLIHRVAYTGVLRVTNPEAFARTLHSGIGRSIGLGFGMLLIEEME